MNEYYGKAAAICPCCLLPVGAYCTKCVGAGHLRSGQDEPEGRLQTSSRSNCGLPERKPGFSVFLCFYAGSEEFLKEAFLDQAIDSSVVDNFAVIESFHQCSQLRVRLLPADGLDGGCQEIRHAFEQVAF